MIWPCRWAAFGFGPAAAPAAITDWSQLSCNLERKKFHGCELDAGYYVNFVFNADPQLIAKLRAKFKLDPEVYRQHFQRLKPKSEKVEKTPKKVAAEQ